jgi:RHS repeat-associated protein
MEKPMIRAHRLLTAIFTLCLASAVAQVQPGVPKFSSFGGGPVDTINLANLNAHFVMPVFHKPGRGLQFNYDLSYDTTIWQPTTLSNGTKAWLPVSAWGWSGSALNIGWLYTATFQDSEFFYLCLTYFDSVGTSHSFPCAAYDYVFGIDYPINSPALDGSGYNMQADAFSGTALLTSPDGSSIVPQGSNPINPNVKPGSVIDRNGNEITTDSTGRIFTDTLGTTALTTAGSNPSPYTFTYTSPAGTAAAVTVTFKSYTVKTNFGCTGITDYPATTVSMVDRLTLPDTSFYQFNYEATPGFTGDITGRLSSVALPTGGTISYAYTGANNGIICTDGSAAGLKRTTPDGVSNYSRAIGTGAASTTTLVDPASNSTVMQFQGVYETERKTYQGSSTLLQTIDTCYNGSVSPCTGTAITAQVTQRSIVTTLGTQQKRHYEAYNLYGMPSETDDYDYGTNAVGALLKKTVFNYPNLGSIKAFVSTVTVTNAAGTTLESVTSNYDQTAVVANIGTTPQHLSVSTPRGNLTSTVATVQGATTLTKTLTYYDTGTVKTSTDVNGAVTTNNYPDAVSTCGNAFPTSVTEPLSLSMLMTWDCKGGVELSTTDENSKISSTKYTDTHFWRPSSTTDATGAVTNITYPTFNSTERSTPVNAGASTVDSLQTVDGLGRVFLSQTKQSPTATTYDSVETVYDSLGRVKGHSLPYSGSAGQTSSTLASTTLYDTLNRPVSVTDAGGGVTTMTYLNNDVLSVLSPAPAGESLKQRQMQYDGLGRLSSVCEITGATGSGACVQTTTKTGFWTKYTYDAIGNMTGVTQNAQAVAAQQQARSYTFDGLNRLKSESNPENGVVSYTYDSDATCGTSKGDLVKKVDAVGNTTCTAYDALHRATALTYTGPYAPASGSRHFVYDAATVNGVAMTNVKTRLAEAYLCPIAGCTSKSYDSGFSYSARGESTDVYESATHSGGYYHVSSTYWENGQMKTLAGIPSVPTLTYGLDPEARPKTVSAATGQNPVTGVTYAVSGQLTSLTYGSGDTDNYTFDPNTLRTATYALHANTQAVNGTLTWNPNGTLKTLQVTDPLNPSNTETCAYGYDDLARQSSANCGTPWNQTFSLDAFGNIAKTATAGTSFQATYAPASNHLTKVGTLIPTYDLNGNLTSDTLHSYQWDAEGNMIGVDVGQGTGSCVYFDALDRMAEHGKGATCATYDQVLYGPGGTKLAIMSGQALSKAFIPLPGGAKAIYTTAGLQYYRRPDWLGSSRLSTTTTKGAKYYDVEYAPYGENYGGNAGTGGAVDLMFTGQNQDTVATSGGLYDFLYREYNPVQGRWISPDPAGRGAVNPADPQSWNRYAYAGNSPLGRVDAQGLDWGDWGGGWGDGGWGGDIWSEQLPIYTGPPLDPSWIIWNYHTNDQGLTVGDYPGEMICPGVEGSTQPCTYWDPIQQLWDNAPASKHPCDITVKCRGIETDHLGLIGMQHCDAQVTDGSGAVHSLSGGPEPNYGQITALNAWDTSPPPGPFTGTTVYQGSSCSTASCLISSTNRWNKDIVKPEYRPAKGPNSNDWLNQTFSGCGASLPIGTWGSIW